MAAKGLSLITKPQVVEYRKLYEVPSRKVRCALGLLSIFDSVEIDFAAKGLSIEIRIPKSRSRVSIGFL